MTEQKKRKGQWNVGEGTIFDDVFRTIAEKMSPFLIPLINEVFGTKYDKNTPIHHDSETHMTLLGKRSTDSCFTVRSEYQYHLECQSNPDSTIVVRFFEYDVAIAIMEAEKTEGIFHIRFPRSAVLYLRHTSNTPDKECMRLEFPDGSSHSYFVPIVKAQAYSLEDIFEKELFILLPFYLLRYEKTLKGIDDREEDRVRLVGDYQRIHSWLTRKTNPLENVNYDDVKDLIVRIADYLLKKEEKTRKGVGDAMGGKVLELFSEQVARHEENVKKLEEMQQKFTQEKQEFTQEKQEFTQEKQEFTQEKQEFTQEKQEFTQEKQEFTQEKQEFVREQRELTQEKQEFAQEKWELVQAKQEFEDKKQQYGREHLVQGETLFAALTKKLLDSGRNEELKRALSDEEYRKELYAEFQLLV